MNERVEDKKVLGANGRSIFLLNARQVLSMKINRAFKK